MRAQYATVDGTNLPNELSPEEKDLFARVIRGLKARRVPFLVAGAFGVYHYTGCWRNTKDMDVLVTMDQFPAAIEVVGVFQDDVARSDRGFEGRDLVAGIASGFGW